MFQWPGWGFERGADDGGGRDGEEEKSERGGRSKKTGVVGRDKSSDSKSERSRPSGRIGGARRCLFGVVYSSLRLVVSRSDNAPPPPLSSLSKGSLRRLFGPRGGKGRLVVFARWGLGVRVMGLWRRCLQSRGGGESGGDDALRRDWRARQVV